MDVSILVSTCNRSADLARFLECLEQLQTPPGRTWELVIVDNKSRDDSAAVIKAAQERNVYPIQHVFEGRQGKSYGLNSGLALARGRLVAFTDDDVVLPPEWLTVILDFFEQHPDAVCVGGRVTLYNPADLPICIRLSNEPAAIEAASFSAVNIPIMGCNMAMRADLLRQVGAFDTDMGPGSRIGVAEDLDYLYRVIQAGHRIHYAPEVHVLHNHGRRSPEHLDRLKRGYLMGRGAFYCKHLLKRDSRVARWAYWEFTNYVGLRTLRAPFDRSVRTELHELWLLFKGALSYLRHGERPALAAH